MIFRCFLGLLLFCTLLASGPSNAIKKAKTLPDYCSKPLILSYYGDWFPYMFERNNRYFGSDWLLLKAITERLGCHLIVRKMPEKRAHQVLIKNHSLVMIGATATQQRREYAHFSRPYRQETMTLFYFVDDKSMAKNHYTDAEKIVVNTRLVAINGAAWYGDPIESLRQQYPKKFLHVPGLANRLSMLERQRADALVEDHYAGCDSIYRNINLPLQNLHLLPVGQTEVAFMFSRAVVTEQFVELFNQQLEQELQQGTYQKLINHYIPLDCSG